MSELHNTVFNFGSPETLYIYKSETPINISDLSIILLLNPKICFMKIN